MKLVLPLILLVTWGQSGSMAVPAIAPRVQESVAPVVADTGRSASAVTGGHIVYATSCSQEDVQAAINAAQDGDTVIVPTGVCTWTTPASMKPAVQIGRQTGWNPPAFESKGITLRGAGVGRTVIVDQTLHGYNENALLIFTAPGKPVRVTGITFDRPGQKAEKGTIGVTGTGQTWRIDHCNFIHAQWGNGIVTSLNTYGVVDHCEFTTDSGTGNFKAFALMGAGDASWQIPLSLGTANAVYIEDCTLNYNLAYRCLDADWGARWVFRHNTVYNNTDVGTHGYDSSPRSQISGEIYHNTFVHNSSGEYYALMPFRGGTGVIFGNTVRHNVGRWNSFVSLYYYCACPGNPTCSHETCTRYPCKDQPGRAPDADGDGVQDLEPIYEWNNTVDIAGPHIVVADLCPQIYAFIQENRDFYNNTPRPGYTPYTYPHPLTQDVLLTTTPLVQAARLDWQVVTPFSFPISTTWRIAYATGSSAPVVAANGLVSATSAYTLTDLVNGVPYTVTLNGMVDLLTSGPTAFFTATAVVTPTGPSLTLHGAPADQAIRLTWEVNTIPPPTTTWQIDYASQTDALSVTLPLSTTRSHTLMGLTNYQWYTVTLSAMLGQTPWLSDTVRVMPTDRFVYLPLVLRIW